MYACTYINELEAKFSQNIIKGISAGFFSNWLTVSFIKFSASDTDAFLAF